MYYLIDPATLTILSGPHSLQDVAVKNRTQCGNPECLPNLADYGIVPAVYPDLGPNQRYGIPPTVTAEAVTFPVENIPLAELKTAKLAELAAIRYQHETGGIALNGATIKTDRESQALVNGAYSYSLLNPSMLIDWKAESGWIPLNAEAITAIAGAVAAYVQSCFSHEMELAAAIEAAETAEAMDAISMETDWPA